MERNAAFIKILQIPFADVLPQGALRTLQKQFKTSEQTPRQVLLGAWTNEPIVEAALQIVREQRNLLTRFLEQFDLPYPAPED